jgi:hypothetical protein
MHELYFALLIIGFVVAPCMVDVSPAKTDKARQHVEMEDEAEEYPLFI